LHNRGLCKLYALTNIIKIIKSRRMRWAGHVSSINDIINAYDISVRKSEGQRP
jgi:hypothetical protein